MRPTTAATSRSQAHQGTSPVDSCDAGAVATVVGDVPALGGGTVAVVVTVLVSVPVVVVVLVAVVVLVVAVALVVAWRRSWARRSWWRTATSSPRASPSPPPRLPSATRPATG